MAKRSHDQEERIKRVIRDAVALDPLISIAKIQEVLEKKNMRVADNRYVAKLRRKIHGEALATVDHATAHKRMAEIKETYRLVRDQLIRIGMGNEKPEPGTLPPLPKDRISALKGLVTLDLALLDAEMDLGIYTRKLGELDVLARRNQPLDGERLDLMLKAMEAWQYKPPMPEPVKVDYTIVETPQVEAPKENGSTTIPQTTLA